MSDCVIRSRIDPEIKEEATKLFERMGLTMSEAIRMFLYKVVDEKRIPFSLNIPNEETRTAFKELEEGKCETVTLNEFKKIKW